MTKRNLPIHPSEEREAGQNDHVKALYMLAASLQIDCVDQNPAHGAIATDIERSWPEMSAQDKRSLDEAKLNLVNRFGEAVRMIAERHPGDGADTYHQLYSITVDEPSYPIRLEGAQEIGAGGDRAFEALKGGLGPPPCRTDPPDNRGAPGEAAAADEAGAADEAAAADEMPDLERPALRHTPEAPRLAEWHHEERQWRQEVVRAWLAPLLVGSVTENTREARKNLENWLQYIGARDGGRGEPALRVKAGARRGSPAGHRRRCSCR